MAANNWFDDPAHKQGSASGVGSSSSHPSTGQSQGQGPSSMPSSASNNAAPNSIYTSKAAVTHTSPPSVPPVMPWDRLPISPLPAVAPPPLSGTARAPVKTRPWGWIIALSVAVAAALLLGSLALFFLGALAGDPVSRPGLVEEMTAQQVFAASTPAVVKVTTGDAQGTGFIVSADGLVLTNAHVIQGATVNLIKVSFADKREMSVEKIIAVDATQDMALLQVRGNFNGKFLEIKNAGPSGVQVGTRIYAIGHPEGFEFTLSDGIISEIRDGSEGREWVQFTAPISHGSSGGPVIDATGNVIGMTTMSPSVVVENKDGIGVASQNLNFAVPCWKLSAFVAKAQHSY